MIPWMGDPPAAAGRRREHAATDFDFGMTDLEERLRGPHGEQVRADVIERFSLLDQRLRVLMSTGVEPKSFEALRRVREALAHARKIVLALK